VNEEGNGTVTRMWPSGVHSCHFLSSPITFAWDRCAYVIGLYKGLERVVDSFGLLSRLRVHGELKGSAH